MTGRVQAAVKRWRKHVAATSGPQTVKAFQRSPYFRGGPVSAGGQHYFWEWDGRIDTDSKLLADEFVRQLDEAAAAIGEAT